jgi:hypothetical protein
MAPSTPLPSPAGDGRADGQCRTSAPSSNLNPLASPFSPSFPSGSVAEELPEWLLFSPLLRKAGLVVLLVSHWRPTSRRWSGVQVLVLMPRALDHLHR